MELTEEQKEAIRKFLKSIIDDVSKMFNAVKDAINKIKALFDNYISKMEHCRRYKLLKSIGIKRYEPFFQRKGANHCRNNC